MSEKDINKVIIVGTLEKDANISTTNNGKIIANLSVITDESYHNGETKVERYERHKVTAWGKQAEFCGSLKKGDRVYIEGKNQTRKNENNFITEVIVTRIE